MKVLFDLNLVIDLFLQRQPWSDDAVAVWDSGRGGRIEAFFSSASFPTLFYLVRKYGDLDLAHIAVTACLDDLTIIPVDYATIRTAATGPGRDVEDNIQIACAVGAKLDAIVTRDLKGFAASPVPALSPAELLAKIATTSDHDPLSG